MTKGKAGFEIYDGFKPQPGEKIFTKTVNSCFKESGLLEYLREKQVKEVAIAGLMTDYCIDATVKCGFEHGFSIIVPKHANTTTDNEYMTASKHMSIITDSFGKGGMRTAFRQRKRLRG